MTSPERHGSRPMGDSAGNSWTVRPCSAEPGRLSEGPRWDGDRSELFWVDVLAGRLHRARPGADGQLQMLQTLQVHGPLGAAAPVRGTRHVREVTRLDRVHETGACDLFQQRMRFAQDRLRAPFDRCDGRRFPASSVRRNSRRD